MFFVACFVRKTASHTLLKMGAFFYSAKKTSESLNLLGKRESGKKAT